jgi:hypothetical protein
MGLGVPSAFLKDRLRRFYGKCWVAAAFQLKCDLTCLIALFTGELPRHILHVRWALYQGKGHYKNTRVLIAANPTLVL